MTNRGEKDTKKKSCVSPAHEARYILKPPLGCIYPSQKYQQLRWCRRSLFFFLTHSNRALCHGNIFATVYLDSLLVLQKPREQFVFSSRVSKWSFSKCGLEATIRAAARFRTRSFLLHIDDDRVS